MVARVWCRRNRTHKRVAQARCLWGPAPAAEGRRGRVRRGRAAAGWGRQRAGASAAGLAGSSGREPGAAAGGKVKGGGSLGLRAWLGAVRGSKRGRGRQRTEAARVRRRAGPGCHHGPAVTWPRHHMPPDAIMAPPSHDTAIHMARGTTRALGVHESRGVNLHKGTGGDRRVGSAYTAVRAAMARRRCRSGACGGGPRRGQRPRSGVTTDLPGLAAQDILPSPACPALRTR